MAKSIVFINIGWMVEYKGPSKTDPTKGGHKWLKNHASGHEAWNFSEIGGKYYGYVPGKANIDIRGFPAATADRVDGVTVVWVARHPQLRRYVIVGWYSNATIFRKPKPGRRKVDGDSVDNQIEVDRKDAHLVPREQRTYPPPSGPKIAFGRSVIYYGNSALQRDVPKFIASGGKWQGEPSKKQAKTAGRGGGRQMDPTLRRRIEKAAILHATKYYRREIGDPGCVTNVEKECKGWDLEVRRRSGEVLLVEVKGTSMSLPCAELTVNEYGRMREVQFRERYVVYIVTNAIGTTPAAHVFRYWPAAPAKKRWRSDDGRVLVVTPREAAALTVKG